MENAAAVEGEAQEVEVTETSQSAPEVSWRDQMAGGVAQEQQKKFRKSLDNYASPADVGRDLLDLRKGIQGRVKIPGDDATEADRDAFARQMGWPERGEGQGAVEAYGYERPENLNGLLGEDDIAATERMIFEGAYEAKIPASAAKWAADTYYSALEKAAADKQEFADKAKQETEAALKKSWGSDYKENMQAAGDFIAKFSDDAVSLLDVELADGRMIGDLPEIMNAFAAAGRATGEIGAYGGPATGAELESVEAQIKAFKERELRGEVLTDSERLHKSELFKQKYGNQPIS